MRVFVTGATGFLGRNFVEFLSRQPEVTRIDCLVRSPEKAGFLDKLGAHVIHGDLLKPDTYAEPIRKAQYVIHIAAKVGLKDGEEFYTVNTEGTRCLLEALKGTDTLRRLVFCSSIAAMDRDWATDDFDHPLTEAHTPHPNTDYGKSKRQAEELIQQSGLEWSILRPSYIFGPWPRENSSMDRVVYHVRDGEPYTRFPFPGVASEIYAGDLAEALWVAALHPAAANEDFFIANPAACPVSTFLEALAKRLGVRYEPPDVSPEVMARFRDFQFARHPDNPVVRILYTRYFQCSPLKFMELTGYTPRIGFEAGMDRTVVWYRRHGKL